MEWNPPDAYASLVLSVGGGVLAGIVVVVIEWTWRFAVAWRQKRKALEALQALMRDWENEINSTSGFEHPESGTTVSKEGAQFAKHKYYLWTVPIVMSRWAKHLPERHVEEFSRLVTDHENAVVGLIPQGRAMSQPMYDAFFRKAREVKWLKF